MAIAFVQAASANAASVAYSSNVTEGNLLVVAVTDNSSSPTSISDTRGNTWYQFFSEEVANQLTIYWAINKSSGANTVTTNASGNLGIAVGEYSGATGLSGFATLETGTTSITVGPVSGVRGWLLFEQVFNAGITYTSSTGSTNRTSNSIRCVLYDNVGSSKISLLEKGTLGNTPSFGSGWTLVGLTPKVGAGLLLGVG